MKANYNNQGESEIETFQKMNDFGKEKESDPFTTPKYFAISAQIILSWFDFKRRLRLSGKVKSFKIRFSVNLDRIINN